MNMRTLSLLSIGLTALVLLGCSPNPERRELQYMPDMYINPALKAQEESLFFRNGSSMQTPPLGTVPRNFVEYPYGILEAERAGAELQNPLPRTQQVFETGRKYYSIHCATCHGHVGAGDGGVTLANREAGFPIPPPLYSDAIRNEYKDGRLYHIITMGQGQMPGYAPRINPEHRWAIVHYIRALGEAAHPTEEDVQAVERLGWDAPTLDNPYTDPDAPSQLFLRDAHQRQQQRGTH